MKKLGFGLMRLPVIDGDMSRIDIPRFCEMVDAFLGAGFTYFDTSAAYHDGMSEAAVKSAISSRYPRGRYFLASKLPTFAITERSQVQQYFDESLNKTGAGYFDNYLLHNINLDRYEGVIKELGMFDCMKRWKDEGRIRHIGFSFHDSPELLDRVLDEHPEVEFVQIALNYLDWEHSSVQARRCYETIRAHGCQVVVMEAVKGGTLAVLPAAVEAMLREANPQRSAVDWSLLFGASLDGVLVSLSGMSNQEQIRQNIRCLDGFTPLSEGENALLARAAAMLDAGMKYPLSGRGVDCPAGIAVERLISLYNESLQEVNPLFSSELNYYATLRRESAPASACTGCGKCAALLPGRDVPAVLREAEAWCSEHSFF